MPTDARSTPSRVPRLAVGLRSHEGFQVSRRSIDRREILARDGARSRMHEQRLCSRAGYPAGERRLSVTRLFGLVRHSVCGRAGRPPYRRWRGRTRTNSPLRSRQSDRCRRALHRASARNVETCLRDIPRGRRAAALIGRDGEALTLGGRRRSVLTKFLW